MTTFTSNGKRRINSASGIGHGVGGRRVDPMVNDAVPVSEGALCLTCQRPVTRSTSFNGRSPRYCDECQRERWRDRKRKQRAPLTCNQCGAELREPDPSGCCGLCLEEAALA